MVYTYYYHYCIYLYLYPSKTLMYHTHSSSGGHSLGYKIVKGKTTRTKIIIIIITAITLHYKAYLYP